MRFEGKWRVVTAARAACIAWLVLALTVGRAAAEDASDILKATGVTGGLIVHVGCGDGTLTAALRAGERYLVHGLDRDPANAEKARAHVRSSGLYGKVSIDHWQGGTLPYVGNLVNLLVIEDAGAVSPEEAMRVLVPEGVAYARDGGSWKKSVKPRPKDIDEWTHHYHDAGNNAVAHDTVVGPPRYMQWVAAPQWSRQHTLPSVSSVVSANGRLFSVVDRGIPMQASEPPKSWAKAKEIAARWQLEGRDAFNGMLLWTKPVSAWMNDGAGFKAGNETIYGQRRLVASGNRVYFTLGLQEPVTEIDGATGETLRVLAGTENTDEMVLCDGVLFTLGSPGRAEAKKGNAPRFATRWSAPRTLTALDLSTGQPRWTKSVLNEAQSALAAAGGKAFTRNGDCLECYSIVTGDLLWKTAKVPGVKPVGHTKVFPMPAMLIVWEDVAIYANGTTLAVLSTKDGSVLWTGPAEGNFQQLGPDLFVANGTLWVGRQKDRAKADYSTGVDPRTGKEKKSISTDLVFEAGDMAHHRCYSDRATDRYLLIGQCGVGFLNLETGENRRHDWVRGTCGLGPLPCNGLLYAPPHGCACYIEAMLTGYWALAAGRSSAPAESPPETRIEKGPAYGKGGGAGAAGNDDWPTYRHDAARSGWTTSAVGPDVKPMWTTPVGGGLSSVVVAGGVLLVASAEQHTLHALDAGDGKRLWDFTAGGRIDSPPTISGGHAIFGSRDGWVYSLRLSDGALAWRFRAAPEDRRTVAFEQVESVWPVHGSVLVRDGVAYFAAGRSSFIDGGIQLYRLDAATGKQLSRSSIYAPDPKTGLQPPPWRMREKPIHPATLALPDVLSYDGEYTYMRQAAFNDAGELQSALKPHLMSSAGFLNDHWQHRVSWAFTDDFVSGGASIWTITGNGSPSGRILVCDDAAVYGYGRSLYMENAFTDYVLFACDKKKQLVADAGLLKQDMNKDAREMRWREKVPFIAHAMVLAKDHLFAAGPKESMLRSPDSYEGEAETLLWAVSAKDGKKVAEWALRAPPVFDGMVVAGGRLYIALKNGTVTCLGK